MKKLLVLIFLLGLSVAANAQQLTRYRTNSGAFTGSCNYNLTLLGLDTSDNTLYYCGQDSAWHLPPPSGAVGGDLSGSLPNPLVVGINGTLLSGLATGILKNTTGTGVPSIITPTQCSGQAPTGIDASGNATGCFTPATPSGTLTNNAFATGAGTSVVKTPNTSATLDASGNAVLNSVTTGASASGLITLTGLTSGSAALGVADIAGTPARINLPIATGAANTVLTTDGGTPQQLSWTTRQLSIQPGLGDGNNAITAATYTYDGYYNDTGGTITITGIKCKTDNSGSTTLDVKNGAGTSLLTGTITCTNAYAGGTQSATTTIASADRISIVIVADGTSKFVQPVISATH